MQHRAQPVSSKKFAFLRTLFIPFILFVFIYLINWLTREKNINKKLTVIYPHWNNKKPILMTVGIPVQNDSIIKDNTVKTHAVDSYIEHREEVKMKPTLMACGIKVQNDPIIKVNNVKTYVVGSYIEHREEVKKIRTISIVLRSENPKYHCWLCCNEQKMSVPASYDIHHDHFGFEYGTADIICQLPEKCTTPTHVAITSRSPEEDGTLHDIPTFQPVRNQKTQEVFPYEFTVCISTMYDYENVMLLVQAMEMYKILGVQKVAIYKTNCSSDVQKVLDYYVRQNFVEIIPWKNVTSYINVSRGWKKSVSPGELHYHGQIPALNDCVYRYMYQSHYVALQDLDEFILPMKHKTWHELLPELNRKYNNKVGFEFETNLFPLSITDMKPEYSPDSWKNVTGDNILEHVYRLRNDPNLFNNFKVIINPRSVVQATVHGLLKTWPDIGRTVRVDSEIGRMYHMRDVSEEIIVKCSRVQDTHHRDYAKSLIPAVSEVLQKALGIRYTDTHTIS